MRLGGSGVIEMLFFAISGWPLLVKRRLGTSLFDQTNARFELSTAVLQHGLLLLLLTT